MASVTPLPGARIEHRGVAYWMDRAAKELERLRNSSDPEVVHDVRVALRRCRSVAGVMEEVDLDPVWPQLRKLARKLFRSLGALRDTQVMDGWIRKLASETDPFRGHWHASFEAMEQRLRENSLRVAAKFDSRAWNRLEHAVRRRSRLVPAGSLTAECLALERFEAAKELHAKAQRTEKPAPWHALRIGLKRFRYTVEGLLPNQYALWSDSLKQLQDILGEIHDLDVLAAKVKKFEFFETEEGFKFWQETIERERRERTETYRGLTLGKTSLWNIWRLGLPTNGRVEDAAMARFRATARALDPHLRRTSQISRIAVALFDAFRRSEAGAAFAEASIRRVLLAAARLQNIGGATTGRSRQKGARKFLLSLALPPGWTREEWELVADAVRYHRGAEPLVDRGSFSKLGADRQNTVRALAGVLRLARSLRKCGVEGGAGIRVEKSAEAILIRVPGLADDVQIASRLAAGKHLLEESLKLPVILKAVEKPEKVLALPQPVSELPAASD